MVSCMPMQGRALGLLPSFPSAHLILEGGLGPIPKSAVVVLEPVRLGGVVPQRGNDCNSRLEGYADFVLAKSNTGIRNPFVQSATRRSSEALFLCPQFNGGCDGGSSERRSLGGIANPGSPATRAFASNGGGSQLPEDHTL